MKIGNGSLKSVIKKLFQSEKKENERLQLEQEEKEAQCINLATEKNEAEARFNLNEELRQKYAQLLKTEPINEKQIVYEAFGGRGMLDSPHAIFKYLLTQPEFCDFLHIWVIDDFSDNQDCISRYRGAENVKFVKYQSLEYWKALVTSKYLINNVSFPGFFTKREGQVYIDTWHGISLKTVGFDIPDGRVSAGNTARNFLAADYLTAANAHMTEIYKTAFRLENIYAGKILEIGQPRSDSYFHTEPSAILEKLKQAGVQIQDGKKIILYAPTWRGSKYSSPDLSLDVYEKLLDVLSSYIDTDKYQILIKPHQIVYYHIKSRIGTSGVYVPATIDTNELLSVTDVLISDYSSIYFDFLVSGRPVLFFIPDLAEFADSRGLYFGLERLPGPIAETYEQLGEFLKNPEKAVEAYKEQYEKEAFWACPKDDGNVCARLVDTFFRGKECQDAVKCLADKKKVLLYAGDLSENQTTRSFFNLVPYLEFEKYDFTLWVDGDKERTATERIRALPSELRILYSGQPFNGTPEEIACHQCLMGKKANRIAHDFYTREGKRLFGNAVFDCAINLCGSRNLFSMVAEHLEKTNYYEWQTPFVNENCADSAGDCAEKADCAEELVILDGEELYVSKSMGGSSPMVTVHTISLPDPKKTCYLCMNDGKNAKRILENFVALEEEDSCLYISVSNGKKRKLLENEVSQRSLNERVFLVDQLKNPFGFMKRCQYFICPKGEEALDTLLAKALHMELLQEDCKTKISYEFDPEAWNKKHYAELSAWMKK